MKVVFGDSNGNQVVIEATNRNQAHKKLGRMVKNPRQYRIVESQDKDLENLVEDSMGYRDLPKRKGR